MDMMEIRRRTIQGASDLPPAYKRADYLQTVGHSRKIDTGVSGADETLKIEMKYMMSASGPDGSYYGPFGNAADTSKKYWCMRRPATSSDVSTTLFAAYLGNSNAAKYVYPYGSGVTLRGKKFHISMTYGRCVVTGDRIMTVTTDTTSAAASEENIFIGTTSRTSSGIAACIGYIWYFKMWSGGKLIRDYVPCIRRSDNKAGFYDLVNRTFNPSIGTSDFVAGYDN